MKSDYQPKAILEIYLFREQSFATLNYFFYIPAPLFGEYILYGLLCCLSL